MNFHSDLWIEENLRQHFKEAVEVSTRDVIGIFLHGSQNYGLDFESSDVDTVCLVMPSEDDIVRGSQPFSHEHIRKNKEHIVFWDIRHFINLLEKGGFNQLEILFTKYNIIADKYKDFWKEISDKKEDLVYSDISRTANSFYGMMCRCVSEIEKNRNDRAIYTKEFMRIYFLFYALRSYLDANDFPKVLCSYWADEIKKQRETTLDYNEILDISQKLKNLSRSLVDECIAIYGTTTKPVCFQAIRKNIFDKIIKENNI